MPRSEVLIHYWCQSDPYVPSHVCTLQTRMQHAHSTFPSCLTFRFVRGAKLQIESWDMCGVRGIVRININVRVHSGYILLRRSLASCVVSTVVFISTMVRGGLELGDAEVF